MERHDCGGRGVDRRQFLRWSAAMGLAGLSAEAWAMMPEGYREPEVTAAMIAAARQGELPRRTLGGTGEDLAIVGFGGFHLIHVSEQEADELLNFYLDCGGNFIETAAAYGRGDSERKIGRAMAARRDDCFLSTKTHMRDRRGAAESLEQSLRNLRTDHVDNLFMHNVSSDRDLDRIMGDDGALRAAEDARDAGKVRFISVTSHSPQVLLRAVQEYPFDAIMEWINYFDYFNFPIIYDRIIPACVERGIGVICMKPVADGLLYRPDSATKAFRWAWTMPEVTSAATGVTSMFQLALDLSLARGFSPMDEREREELYLRAPELANYVCRRCGRCMPNKAALDIPEIFRLEGYYDRQMMPGPVVDLPDKDVRRGIANWFRNRDYARAAYAALEPKVGPETDCSDVEPLCPYGLPITAKLKWTAQKLTSA